MIGHDNMRAQFNVREMIGNGTPAFVRDSPVFVRYHFPIHNFPKQHFAPPGNDGHEIRARPRMVISFQANAWR